MHSVYIKLNYNQMSKKTKHSNNKNNEVQNVYWEIAKIINST